MDQPDPIPSPAHRPMGRNAAVFVAGVIFLGVVVVGYSLWDVFTHGVRPIWFVLLALTFVTGWATLRVPEMPISFSISDTFNIIAALIFGPAAGALTAALDGGVLSYRMLINRRSVHRVLFNMAAPAIATWLSAQVFLILSGPAPRVAGPLGALRLLTLLTVFAVLDFFLNTGIVAAAIAFERRKPLLAVWREHFLGLWVTYFGGAYAAALMMMLSGVSLSELLILIAPLPIILYVTFRHALGRSQDQIGHLAQVNRVYLATIEGLAQAIDAKDHVTHEHTRRVQNRSVRLARALAIDDDGEIQAIKAASLLHDVGKIAIPEHILNKPGRLTPSEFQIMKRHAPIGADMLTGIGFPYPVVPIVRHHHEHWDGSGYPDGLAGDAIPIGARILAVVDCFDALTSDRPYRPRLDDRDALQILTDRRGTMYDPTVVDAFFKLHASEESETEKLPERPASAAPVDPHGPTAPALAEVVDDSPAFETAYDLGRALIESDSAAEVGEAIWTYLRRHVPASAFVLFAYDAATDSISAVHTSGEGLVEGARTRITLGERLSGWVAATRQSILNSDARLDFDEHVREASPLRSALAVPIVADRRTIGVLTVYSCESGVFNETHRRVAYAAAFAAARQAVYLVPSVPLVGASAR